MLWARQGGLEIVWVPLLWAAASAVKMLVAIPGGYWSDQFGRLPVLVVGWSARILILIALGLTSTNELTIWILFLAYAGSLAFTEGAERALIGDYAPAAQKATAYGIYHMISGVLALPGALLFGALWQWQSATVAFFTAAVLTTLSVLVLLLITSKKTK